MALKLHGVAIAVVAKSDNPNILSVTCTPIAISDKSHDGFEVLKDFCPNDGMPITFDLNDTKKLTNCFVQIVNVLDKVTALQKQSCADEKIPYQPVTIDIGENGDNPTNADALYMHLFNERKSPPQTYDDIERKYKKTFDQESQYLFRKPYERLKDAEKEALYKTREIRDLITENDTYEANIRSAQTARDVFLAQHGNFPSEYKDALKKLPALLAQCSLRLDSFSRPAHGFWERKELLEQKQLDQDLIRLKPAFEKGDKDAFEEIKGLARKEGELWGERENTHYKGFKRFNPPNYNEEMREKLPRFSYYQWDKAFEQAFHEGFQEKFLGPHNMRMKLPCDPNNPLFTDPVFYRLLDQLEVVNQFRTERGDEGFAKLARRSTDGILDNRQWRERVSISAEQQASYLQ